VLLLDAAAVAAAGCPGGEATLHPHTARPLYQRVRLAGSSASSSSDNNSNSSSSSNNASSCSSNSSSRSSRLGRHISITKRCTMQQQQQHGCPDATSMYRRQQQQRRQQAAHGAGGCSPMRPAGMWQQLMQLHSRGGAGCQQLHCH